jgi:hypothetical protein
VVYGDGHDATVFTPADTLQPAEVVQAADMPREHQPAI